MDNNTLINHLHSVLMKDSRFRTDDGQLIKNAIVEAALNLDATLISYLLSDELICRQFFITVNDVKVFDKVRFQRFVMNKSFLPDSYTAFKNKVGLTNENGDFLSESREVVLSWPYKDCVLEGGQTKEDAKRDEIFWNETLAPDEINRIFEPKALTNFRRYDQDGEHEVSSISKNDNLIIKGNNLLALHSLKKVYAGQVKLIYIDPPFNTENDSFNYNDKFTRSTWLTFMRNRLSTAYDLLSDDGNIFIHIDINQSHYLKVLCDEVFREENLVEELIWAYGSPSGGRAASAKPVNIHDYILHYAKHYDRRKQKHVYIPYSEKYINDWFKYKDDDGRLYQKRQRGYNEDGSPAWERQYLDESKGIPLSTVWSDIKQVYANPMAYKSGNTADMEVIKEFKGGQKPEALIARVIDMCTTEGDLIMDFHLGTGTTAATAHKKGRKYIGVEQIDNQIATILKRLNKVINGDQSGISKSVGWNPQHPTLMDGDKYANNSFVYCELANANQTFVDKIIAAEDSATLQNLWKQIQQTGFLSYKVQPKEIDKNVEDFASLSLDDQKRFLIECLDMNLLYIPYSDMNDKVYSLSDNDMQLTNQFYSLK